VQGVQLVFGGKKIALLLFNSKKMNKKKKSEAPKAKVFYCAE
jgi:hypothetical protein